MSNTHGLFPNYKDQSDSGFNGRSGMRKLNMMLSALIALSLLLMGCDKASKNQNEKASAEKMSKRTFIPANEMDLTQSHQLIPIGEVTVKIPTGHLARVNEDSVILEASIVVTQEGKPRFLTSKNVEEIRKMKPSDTYNHVFVYVNKTHVDVKQGSKFDEKSALRNSFVSPLKPPLIMEELGLKQYTRILGSPQAVYFPLDPNFTMPGGGIFSMRCAPVPPDPKTVARCTVIFVPKDRVSVRYSFPPQYLRYWKEVHQFVLEALQFTK